jgi:hypothetical protein
MVGGCPIFDEHFLKTFCINRGLLKLCPAEKIMKVECHVTEGTHAPTYISSQDQGFIATILTDL